MLKKWTFSITGDSGDSGDWAVLQVYLDSIQNEPKSFKLILKKWSFSIFGVSGDSGDWIVLQVYLDSIYFTLFEFGKDIFFYIRGLRG